MKKYYSIIALFVATVSMTVAQVREDRLDILDASRLVLSIELNYPSKTVESALSQKLKESGIKTKSSKGLTTAEGAKFLDVAADNQDYYFKVESKDKTKSVVYLGISKGYTNFVTGESDAKTWQGGKDFLTRFEGYVFQYQLAGDIAAQEKVIKDAEKAVEKSKKDGEDLAKKVEENKKDQEAKQADLDKQNSLLGELKGKVTK